ncbi:MAG: (2Fe-2S)-binding protein [Planctomycetaceae bacterium]|nr:MAG: (2Fe-2S)-binding protein [Planctomycetaceae bacterium]
MRRLLDVLRDSCGMTGTKNCCGEGDCGACTVLVDGAAVVSCLVPVVQVEGADVRTVEGLAQGDHLHSLQQAFLEWGGTQCGMCAPGFLMTAWSHLNRGGQTGDAALRDALSGVLCRCTGYNRVIESVQHAATGVRRNVHDDL